LKNAWVNRWKTATQYAPNAERQHHVAELADCRVREHAFDVVLDQSDRGGQDRREGAGDGDVASVFGAA